MTAPATTSPSAITASSAIRSAHRQRSSRQPSPSQRATVSSAAARRRRVRDRTAAPYGGGSSQSSRSHAIEASSVARPRERIPDARPRSVRRSEVLDPLGRPPRRAPIRSLAPRPAGARDPERRDRTSSGRFGGGVGGGSSAVSRRPRTRSTICQRSAHERIGPGSTHCQPDASGSPNSHRPSECVSGAMHARVPTVERLGARHVPGPLNDDRPPLVARLEERRPARARSDGERLAVLDPRGPEVVEVGPAAEVALTVPEVAAPRRRARRAAAGRRARARPLVMVQLLHPWSEPVEELTRRRSVRAGRPPGPARARPRGTCRPCRRAASTVTDRHGQ